MNKMISNIYIQKTSLNLFEIIDLREDYALYPTYKSDKLILEVQSIGDIDWYINSCYPLFEIKR